MQQDHSPNGWKHRHHRSRASTCGFLSTLPSVGEGHEQEEIVPLPLPLSHAIVATFMHLKLTIAIPRCRHINHRCPALPPSFLSTVVFLLAILRCVLPVLPSPMSKSPSSTHAALCSSFFLDAATHHSPHPLSSAAYHSHHRHLSCSVHQLHDRVAASKSVGPMVEDSY